MGYAKVRLNQRRSSERSPENEYLTKDMAPKSEVKKKVRPSRFQVIAARNLLHKMTQEELASAAGVSQPVLALFEAGQTKPHDSTIEKIQKALEDRGIIFTNGDTPSVTLDRSKAIIPI